MIFRDELKKIEEQFDVETNCDDTIGKWMYEIYHKGKLVHAQFGWSSEHVAKTEGERQVGILAFRVHNEPRFLKLRGLKEWLTLN